MGYGGGGGFLSEAGLRERAQAEGRVFGAGGREFEFGLFGFGTLVLLGKDLQSNDCGSRGVDGNYSQDKQEKHGWLIRPTSTF